jgi:hypothetical protein
VQSNEEEADVEPDFATGARPEAALASTVLLALLVAVAAW